MSFRNTPERWGWVSQLLHWLIALAIVVIAIIGLSMGDLPNSPRKVSVYALHKSLGLTVLALAAARLAWRLYAGAPRHLPGVPAWQRWAASATHVGLYLMMFAMPLTGWWLNSAAGYPLQWFKAFNLPALAAQDDGMRALAEAAHEAGFWLLLLMVLVHAGAALFHHVFLRDDTLRRMLPRRQR
ncbi:cytochrome b [Lysobacter olei]